MIFSSGSRIGSLCRATQSRLGTGFPGAAFVCCASCCAYASCTHVAAAPPRRAEKSRRFTGHLHSRIAHGLEAIGSFFNLPQAELGAEGGYRKAESAGMPLH